MNTTGAHLPQRDDGTDGTVAEYLKRAGAACEEGDAVLGMHLYLAAFEEASGDGSAPSEEALSGLRRAWSLACARKERSLAEYIFEKLEPFLNADEVASYADQLQDLALGRLEEFGLSRNDLEGMAEMITQDVLGAGSRVVKVEHVMDARIPRPSRKEASSQEGESPAGEAGEAAEAGVAAQGPSSSGEGEGRGGNASSSNDGASEASVNPLTLLAKAAQESGLRIDGRADKLDYRTVSGYGNVVRMMREAGIGLKGDADFEEFVGMLNSRHGLESMPALDTLLFRSPAREDAARFAEATVGELGLPAVHMHMEENLQGLPVLCVTARADNLDGASRSGSLRNMFERGGVLVLEDVDMWGAPLMETGEEVGNLLMMQLSRGAREAIGLIRSAVDNPEVYVLATTSTQAEIDPFFLDLLEPISFVDIDYPTPEERVEIWMDIAREHPSIRGVNRADLVRLSANMPRFDMYMAAREAIEEAYKIGLMSRRYQPVTRENLFDKLAAYQPLESREYHELEEAVISDFRRDLDRIDDLLEGE